MPPVPNWQRVTLRWLIRRAPKTFQARFAAEIEQATEQLIADRRASAGAWAAWQAWGAAMVDTTRVVRRERRLDRVRWFTWPSGASYDLRSVWRSWRRTPLFPVSAVLIVGLGLTLNAGLFSFVDGFLFRPLPFVQGDQLFVLGMPESRFGALSIDDMEAIERSHPGVSGIAHWGVASRSGSTWLVDGRSVPVLEYAVSPDFDRVLGFQLVRGRSFQSSEHAPGETVPCWLSFAFWQKTFGGDPDVIGRHVTTISFDGKTRIDVTVVGIMPALVASFDLNNPPPEIVTPAIPRVVPPAQRPFRLAHPILRLQPEVTPQQAMAMLQAVIDASPAPTGTTAAQRRLKLTSLRTTQTRGGAPTATLLFVLGLLVLLLVAVSFGHLLLARVLSQTGELSIRAALGASRARLVRLVLVESLLVSAGGLLVGLGGGWMVSSAISANVPQFPNAEGHNLSLVPLAFDHRVAGFTALLAVSVAIGAALMTAFAVRRAHVRGLARTLSRARDRMTGRASQVVLTTQVALATVVLVGTTLVGVSAWRFLHQPLGFQPRDVFSFSITPAADTASADVKAAAWLAARASVEADVAKLPAIRDIGVGDWYPNDSLSLAVNDRPLAKGTYGVHRVDGTYFDAMGVPMRLGRAFDAAEATADAPVAVVDDVFAAAVWPGRNPIGQVFRDGSKTREVIGVVGHARLSLVRETPAAVYLPLNGAGSGAVSGIIGAPGLTLAQARSLVAPALSRLSADSLVHLYSVDETMKLRAAGEYEFQGTIVTILGVVALLIAAGGLFSVVSYLVERRLREFGVRLALGARATDVWAAVVRQGVVPAIVGVTAGLVAAIWATRFLRAMLYGVAPADPVLFASVAACLLLAAIAASVRPARRAMRVDPVVVLRSE